MQVTVFEALTLPRSGHEGPMARIVADGTQYAAYFENEHGEQLVFDYHYAAGTGSLWHSDVTTPKSHPVTEGTVTEINLSSTEQQWLSLC